MKEKVIIVGAGIGGLSTAIRLLKEGYEVKVIEKNEFVGGKVNKRIQGDMIYDLTASILMMPREYYSIFTDVNRDLNDYVTMKPIEPLYRVFYSDGSYYDFSTDLVKLTSMLEQNFSKDVVGYFKILVESFNKYKIAEKYFLNKSFSECTDFFNSETIIKALEINTFTSIYDYLGKYIESSKLKEYLSFQAMYVGLSPYEGPNIYTLIPATTEMYGLWYIEGGIYSYVEALKRLVEELGGIIVTDCPVEKIDVSNGKVVGVETKYSKEKADIVVCNADYTYAIKNLLDYNETDSHRKYKYSCSTFIIYLTLKRKYNSLMVHNIFICDKFEENMNQIFNGELAENPPIYIYCPTAMEPEEEYEKLNLMVRVPNLLDGKDIWDDDLVERYRHVVMNSVKSIEAFKNIEEDIINESYLTPRDLLEKFNTYGGCAFGINHNLIQTNYFRPGVKSNEVENLYFVGDSVQPGAGISVVLISSRIAVEEIVKTKS